MTATANFFADLAQQGHNPVFEKADGTVRFQLSHGNKSESWDVTVHGGDVSVARDATDSVPTCTVRADREIFDEIASGRANAMAAVLRGDVLIDGNVRMILLFNRVFPGPPGAEHPRLQPSLARSGR